MKPDSQMKDVAAIGRDLEALGVMATDAVSAGDWLALQRLEGVRMALLQDLPGFAGNAACREQVLAVLYRAQAIGAQLSTAIDGRCVIDRERDRHDRQSARAGRAYAHVKSA